jgi:putative PIN family toxin of toxin-antitoxin system
MSARHSPQGKSYQCLNLAFGGAVSSVTCIEILDEFERKLLAKFKYDAKLAAESVSEIRNCSRVVTLTGNVRGVVPDPDDDKIIECAVVGHASHIITGDKRHLLPLGNYQGIQIVSPADFLALIATP